ncbi:MAG: hypothetical protein QME96_18980, partial [Myxococcota bacterium]|nr:hypothetical protein [Myxococcota bacterium]
MADDAAGADGARPESSDESGPPDGADVETRPGGSPGVLCRKVPSPSEDVSSGFDGEESLVAFCPWQGVVRFLHLFDYQRSTSRILETLEDISAVAAYSRGCGSQSLDLPRIAYGVDYFPESDPDRQVAELRVLHLESGDRMTVSRIDGRYDRGGVRMNHVTLRYPWVAWLEHGALPGAPDVSGWRGYAMNLETGHRTSFARLDGMEIDLLGTTALITSGGGVVYEVDV